MAKHMSSHSNKRRLHTPHRIRALQRAHGLRKTTATPQTQSSPFFTKLPGKLRNMIYALAFPTLPAASTPSTPS